MTPASMISALTGPSATRASRTGTAPEMAAPMTGMKAPKKTGIATPARERHPSTAATRPIPIASAAATSTVARVKALS